MNLGYLTPQMLAEMAKDIIENWGMWVDGELYIDDIGAKRTYDAIYEAGCNNVGPDFHTMVYGLRSLQVEPAS